MAGQQSAGVYRPACHAAAAAQRHLLSNLCATAGLALSPVGAVHTSGSAGCAPSGEAVPRPQASHASV